MQSRIFHHYQWGRLLVIVGSEAQALAVSWQVYQFTHSAVSLGLTGLWLILPGLLLFPLAGFVADRYDRKLVILCAYVTQAFFTAALLWISLHPNHGVASIYAVLFGIGTGRCFSGPASSALLPMLVPEQDLVRAVTWGETVFQFANVGGPIVGGLLFTIHGVVSARWQGAPLVYCCSLTTICIFLGLFTALPVRGSFAGPVPRAIGGTLAGFRFVLQNKTILGPIVLDLFSILFGGAVALLPFVATGLLHSGAASLGLLRATPGMGALVASLLLILRPDKKTKIYLIPWAAASGIATIVFACSRWTWLSLSALFMIGAIQMVSLVGRSSILQLTTPPELRGRVGAISWILLGSSNELGALESGLTAEWFGVVRAIVLGGIASLTVTGLAGIAFPTLRSSDTLDAIRAARKTEGLFLTSV